MWGTWDLVKGSDLEACAEREQPTVARLVTAFERHHVPATWAVVGRLFDRPPALGERPGPERCWYDPALLDTVRRSPVPHEIGSHGYAHAYFDQIGRSEAHEDLALAAAAHRRVGLPFDSFVFPRNGVANLREIARAGLSVFRSRDGGLLGAVAKVAPRLRPLANLAEKALGVPPPLVAPRAAEAGLVEMPSSTLLLGRGGARQMIHPLVTGARLLGGVRRASTCGRVFHLWFHPSNFYVDADVQFGVLDAVLAEAAALRARGLLDIRVMGSFAGDIS